MDRGCCNALVLFEDASRNKETHEYLTHLETAYYRLVVDRRRKPVSRVKKMMYCPISIAIEYSRVFRNGELSSELALAWPYTRQDLRNKDLVDELRSREKHKWQTTPPGKLEGMDWDHIKREYGNTIERQNIEDKSLDEDTRVTEPPPPGGSETKTTGQVNKDPSTEQGLQEVTDRIKGLSAKGQTQGQSSKPPGLWSLGNALVDGVDRQSSRAEPSVQCGIWTANRRNDRQR
jgi:hypothetical protein